MAEALQFDLVSPERRIASYAATEVQIPGTEGDLTAMAGHVPVITTLRPGLVRVVHDGKTDEYVVSGGFAQIGAQEVSVLAERSVHRDEITQDTYNQMLSEARRAHRDAQDSDDTDQPGLVDDAAKLVEDMVAVGGHIGLDPNQSNF